ncbi:energy transducer TonB [Niveibacterium microcysteis]|uniref:Energy transducer TonB n=2 Tax=Niveibacterium microcysteis TaxID=2811415 RepID=A0ABX7M4J6_9RHOO|nr:energy transducer TonB [Niveibacterium microcysteis]
MEQGTVGLEFLITSEGRPRRVTVAKSSGFPLLDGAAVAAITNACFKPFEKDGKFVEQATALNFEWRLE